MCRGWMTAGIPAFGAAEQHLPHRVRALPRELYQRALHQDQQSGSVGRSAGARGADQVARRDGAGERSVYRTIASEVRCAAVVTQPFGAIEAGGTKFICVVGTGPDDIRDRDAIPDDHAGADAPADAGVPVRGQVGTGRSTPWASPRSGRSICDPGSPTYGSDHVDAEGGLGERRRRRRRARRARRAGRVRHRRQRRRARRIALGRAQRARHRSSTSRSARASAAAGWSTAS